MNNLMLALKRACPFIETKWCQILIGFVVFLNPIAMLPQLFTAFTAPAEQLAGIAVSTFMLFAAIQTAVALSAIRALDWKLFGSMAISFVQSITIVVAVLIRG